jgi:hypothetical protein
MTKKRHYHLSCHLIIRHSFELRHSDFVILTVIWDFEIRISNFAKYDWDAGRKDSARSTR